MKRSVAGVTLSHLSGAWLVNLPHKEPHPWWLEGEGLSGIVTRPSAPPGYEAWGW